MEWEFEAVVGEIDSRAEADRVVEILTQGWAACSEHHRCAQVS